MYYEIIITVNKIVLLMIINHSFTLNINFTFRNHVLLTNVYDTNIFV
jgi:hypothetical protein